MHIDQPSDVLILYDASIGSEAWLAIDRVGEMVCHSHTRFRCQNRRDDKCQTPSTCPSVTGPTQKPFPSCPRKEDEDKRIEIEVGSAQRPTPSLSASVLLTKER